MSQKYICCRWKLLRNSWPKSLPAFQNIPENTS